MFTMLSFSVINSFKLSADDYATLVTSVGWQMLRVTSDLVPDDVAPYELTLTLP